MLMVVMGVMYLGTMKVDYSGVVCFMVDSDILELSGSFVLIVVEVEVENFEMVVGCFVRLVL